MREVAHRICEAWSSLSLADWRALAGPGIAYQNMPWPELTSIGPDAVFQSLQQFSAKYHVTSDILLTLELGNDIVVERIETLSHKHNPELECSFAVLGVFQFFDGELVEWRDYFDGNALVKLLSGGDGSSQFEN